MTRPLRLLVLACLPWPLTGQGIMTAAIQGTVRDEGGAAVAGATIEVTNTANGRRWIVTARAAGGYLLEDVAVGGPYRIEARALGFAPAARTGIVLALGQRLVADFVLKTAAVELSPVTVTATADPILNAGRTGPGETIPAERIEALPNLGRDFLALTSSSPFVALSPSAATAATGGITVGGQNRLLNGFLIDGGMNHDPYTGRLPGRETLPRPIALDAIKEIQVLVAPFDVRQGGFAGGLVNVVTKSGTNAVHGSVFASLADEALVGRDAAGDPASGFTTWQYGGTIGGPIVRDRAHFFLSVDAQQRFVPDPGPLITDTAGGADTLRVGIRRASAERFQDILQTTWGLDPGTLGPSDGRVTATDVLAKISVQLGTSSHLELSHHVADGDRWGFIVRQYALYLLTSQGRRDPATAHASRVIWTSLPGGRWSNELVASYLRLRDQCRPAVDDPEIRVTADDGVLVAGAFPVCPNAFAQGALEITDNLSAGFGTHVLTLGTRLEALRFEDGQLNQRAGAWGFDSLDSLAAGLASSYQRGLPAPSRTGTIEFAAHQIGLYVQDRWNPKRSVTLTAGIRVDVPYLPETVAANDSLKAVLGIDSGGLPSGRVLWSPRFGVHYDVRAEGRTFVRGGIGLFSGRPPYSWVGNAYRDDGTQQLFLSCMGRNVPRFVDPLNQPSACVSGAGPRQQLTFFDVGMKFPQSLKVALGVDHRLPGDIIATVDGLYARAVHGWYYSDANLAPPVGLARGEGNRPLYGTIDSLGIRPARPAAQFGPVVHVSNRDGDASLSVSVQLRKQFGDRAEVRAFYAHTRARDRMSLVNPQARALLQNTPLDGTMEDRRLRPSYFEIPHRVELSAVVRLPYRGRLALLYTGSSGRPFTYTIVGDANADGIGGGFNFFNDIVYVPRDSLDIALADPADWGTLKRFIEAEPCLHRERGRIPARNSCRNPWFGTLNARLTKAIPTGAGQSIELTADVYNILNLLHRGWGQWRVTTLSPGAPMLKLVGYDAAVGRGIYGLLLPGQRQIQDLPSRWQVELSARYVF